MFFEVAYFDPQINLINPRKRNSEPNPSPINHLLCSASVMMTARSAPDLREEELSSGSRSSSPGMPYRNKTMQEKRRYRRRRTSAGSGTGRRTSFRSEEDEDPWLEFHRENTSPIHSPLHYYSSGIDNKNCRSFSANGKHPGGQMVSFNDVIQYEDERRQSTSSCPASTGQRQVIPLHKVRIVGSQGVGKSNLIDQFTSTSVIYAALSSDGSAIHFDENRVHHTKRHSVSDKTMSCDNDTNTATTGTISVSLEDEESDVIFEEIVDCKITPKLVYSSDAIIVVYSVTEGESFLQAEQILRQIKQLRQDTSQQSALGALFRPLSKAILLVSNKVDLARRRAVTTDEGRTLAMKYDSKFIETSTYVGHNVEKLLVGTLKQIRLKARSGSVPTSCRLAVPSVPSAAISGSRNICCKAQGLIRRFLQRVDQRARSCDNLHAV